MILFLHLHPQYVYLGKTPKVRLENSAQFSTLCFFYLLKNWITKSRCRLFQIKIIVIDTERKFESKIKPFFLAGPSPQSLCHIMLFIINGLIQYNINSGKCMHCGLTQLIEICVTAISSWYRADQTGLEECRPLVHQTPLTPHVILSQNKTIHLMRHWIQV